ncbi:MAG: DUF1573 domain-containing protein [Planctomycetaceae bacterium]|nr:MAG: DUF1573 domain-containing protein [Planctomycetaceae bacterium]
MPFRRCKAAGILAGCFVPTAVLFAAFSYFGSWAALRAYIGGHSVYVFPSAVDLGECKAGTEVSVSFFVENLTSSELSIVGKRASCACVVETEIPVTIQPRQTVSIDVMVRLHQARQSYEQTIVFMLAEPNRLTVHPVSITAVVLDAPIGTATEEASISDRAYNGSLRVAVLARANPAINAKSKSVPDDIHRNGSFFLFLARKGERCC